MDSEILFEQLKQKKLWQSNFFSRDLVVIRKKDFDAYKEYFINSKNILNNLSNYRSNHYFRHIHAIDFGEYVQIHMDNGNMSKFLLFAIPHFFFDMIPYFTYHLINFKKPYSLK